MLNPLAKGAEDPRAKSFIRLMEDVLPELVEMGQHPRYMLVENVAGFEVRLPTICPCAVCRMRCPGSVQGCVLAC